MANIKYIKIGTTTYDIVSGDSVSYTASLQSGTTVGTLTINGNTYTIYCETVPTNVSDFTNDAGYITDSALTDYYTKTQVDLLVGQITAYEVVASLPVSDIKTNVIYLVGPIGSGLSDAYEEYVYSNSTWVKIGETTMDLSNYYNKTEVNTLLGGKQDTIDASHKLPASNVSGLAAVATSGSYADLSNTPTTFTVSYDSVNEALVFTQN